MPFDQPHPVHRACNIDPVLGGVGASRQRAVGACQDRGEQFEVFRPDFRKAGGRRMEIVQAAPAHTPGDANVWLPEGRVIFAGDIVFTERLRGVLEFSSSAGWLEVFDAMAALEPILTTTLPTFATVSARISTRMEISSSRPRWTRLPFPTWNISTRWPGGTPNRFSQRSNGSEGVSDRHDVCGARPLCQR